MDDHSNSQVDLVDDEFERLGRLAGAELRQLPPADGPGAIRGAARRRRANVAAVAAGVTVAIVVTGLLVANSRTGNEPAPIATVPPTPAPVVPPTTPSEPDDAAPPDAERTTTPGTWRAVADPSALAPGFPIAAVWTGTDVIVVGSNRTDKLSPPTAAAYDVGQDRWRRLADPPPAFTPESLSAVSPAMQWTGSEVLAATIQGEVYGYDPVQDRWQSRASAKESMSLPATDALVGVSARGVLARSSTGWWWYENSTDRWESVPAPSDSNQYSTLASLDQDRIVAVQTNGATIVSAVFDIAARSWRTGPPIEDTPAAKSQREPTGCAANDGLLVCFAEGFSSLNGVVIDPLVGRLHTFDLGPHSNTFSTRGLPWMTHAWKLFSPRSATWEDLPPRGTDEFSAAVWTGSEIVFLGGVDDVSGTPVGLTAAYTPLQLPGR